MDLYQSAYTQKILDKFQMTVSNSVLTPCEKIGDDHGKTLRLLKVFLITCKYSGAAVTLSSQKQRSVVLSTTEAECVAASERASERAKEIIWLTLLLSEIT